MFRRETVHSHFFVPPSLFRFSVSVPCCPYWGGSLFLAQRSSAEGLANGADTPTLPKTSGLRVRYVVGEREDGAPGLFRQASRVDGGGIM